MTIRYNIYYRKAKHKDLDAICELNKQLHDIHYNNLPWYFSKSITGLKEMLEYQLDNYIVYVAENDDGKIVGYISFSSPKNELRTNFTKPQTKVTVHEIFVLEQYRNKGIAHKLMKKCKEYAKELNVKQIELNVFSFNDDAIAFYKSEGFSNLKTTMNYYEENDDV